jgi:threonine aldolase
MVALEQMVERLAEDHANARMLAEGLTTFPQIAIDLDAVQTNIVIFRLRDERWKLDDWVDALAEHGVYVGKLGHDRVRAVTHYGIAADDIEETLQIMRSVLITV